MKGCSGELQVFLLVAVINICQPLFAQLLNYLLWTTFPRLVNCYRGNRSVKSLACTEQFSVFMDRGYLEFEQLHVLHQANAFFVTRAKFNLKAHSVHSTTIDRSAGIISNQTIELNLYESQRDYPSHLCHRQFKYWSPARR